MAQILNVKINLDKIIESKAFKGKSGRYYDVTITINDESDKFGNNVSVYDTQSKEDRENKVEKNYIGNGKTIWASGKTLGVQSQPIKAVPNFDNDLPF